MVLDVVLCVLDQDVKFQNVQAQKREKGISTNLSVKENTSILLQTAVVRLTNKINSKSVKVRVLFDSGSQKSYVTQRIVDCLELKKIASESINVSVFRQWNSISKNVNIFSLCMPGVSKNQKYCKEIPINAYAVPLICNPLKNQVFDIEGHCFEHLKVLNLVIALMEGGGARLMF